MVADPFLDREQELSRMRERYEGSNAEFLVIYGRRRVGKSELIDQFLQNTEGIRLLAREEAKTLQLRRFSSQLARYFDDDLLRTTPFSDWDGFFEYLYTKSDQRCVIAIDEFPYLVKEDPSLPSVLQACWDLKLKNSSIYLIISGSSVSMMESMVMAYKSPLYGRRTGQYLLRPLRFTDIYHYIGDIRKAVEYYAVFGGTPTYILSADISGDIAVNIQEKILNKDSVLFRDVEFVLRTELQEPRYYFSILLAIANGNHRTGLIVNETGLSKGIVSKYLSILRELDLVQKEVPVTESDKSRKSLYFLSDNLFTFWFRFVYPSVELLERGMNKVVLDHSIMPHFNAYVGKRFENMILTLFWDLNGRGVLPLTFTKAGRWWHKGTEIDIIAISESEKKILYCECKWQDRVPGSKIIRELKEKAKKVPTAKKNYKEYYYVIARSFSTGTSQIRDPDVLLIDSEALDVMCKKVHET